MKRLIITLLLCIICGLASAQVQIEVQSGVASYGLNDLIEWQEATVASSRYDLSVISSFPSHQAIQANILFKIKKLQVGGGLSYFSTGGRMGYWDETGSAVEDQLLKRNAFHVIAAYPLMSKGKIELDMRSSLVFSSSTLDFTSTLTLGQEVSEETDTFRSNNLSLLPSANLKYQIIKHVGLMLSFGIELDLSPTSLESDDNNALLLTIPSGGGDARLSYTGFRALGGVYFSL